MTEASVKAGFQVVTIKSAMDVFDSTLTEVNTSDCYYYSVMAPNLGLCDFDYA